MKNATFTMIILLAFLTTFGQNKLVKTEKYNSQLVFNTKNLNHQCFFLSANIDGLLEKAWLETFSINGNGTGLGNATLGFSSGVNNTEGVYNVLIGSYSGYNNTTGSVNVYIGSYSGYSNMEGKRNVFIGYKSGYHEKGSNKLYIANSATKMPLIYGEFNNDMLQINGSLHINDILVLRPKNIPPKNPTEGTIYLDKQTRKIKMYDGFSWKTIAFE